MVPKRLRPRVALDSPSHLHPSQDPRNLAFQVLAYSQEIQAEVQEAVGSQQAAQSSLGFPPAHLQLHIDTEHGLFPTFGASTL